MVVKRGVNEDSVLPMARHFRGTRPHPALHRVHGRRPLERLAPGRRRPRRRDRRRDRRRVAARAGRAELPRRGREALALPRRRRRDRRHRVGHAAVLRRLHARAALGRGPALHLPLRRPRPRPARARPRRRVGRRAARGDRRGSGRGRADRYSELRSGEHGRAAARSRCATSAGSGTDIGMPTARHVRIHMPVRERRSDDRTASQAGRAHLPRGWARPRLLPVAIWFGFLLAYQVARGLADRHPDAGVRERPWASSGSSSASGTCSS